MNKLLENPQDTQFELLPLIHRSMHKKIENLKLAIDGNITQEQVTKLNIILQNFQNIQNCKTKLETEILLLTKPYQAAIDLVDTVPGIGQFSAITIVSEIGTDMSVFPTAKHLCSWAGLTPQNNESAKKKKSVRISRAGVYLKPLLVQCANAVVTSSKHPEIRNRYLALKKRRGHKRAIIAISRMLLTAIYHILKNSVPYNAELYTKPDVSPNIYIYDSTEYAIKLLQKKGYSVLKLPEAG